MGVQATNPVILIVVLVGRGAIRYSGGILIKKVRVIVLYSFLVFVCTWAMNGHWLLKNAYIC